MDAMIDSSTIGLIINIAVLGMILGLLGKVSNKF